ncbi:MULTISPECIES: PSPA7_2676 family Cys-rich small protein [Pseudomonas]|nr:MULTISPECIES: PSPA7_2676 family Cys-rich small protein [Pseudomonas]
MSIICLIKGCEWLACAPQTLGSAPMTCERCERCGALRYHSVLAP